MPDQSNKMRSDVVYITVYALSETKGTVTARYYDKKSKILILYLIITFCRRKDFERSHLAEFSKRSLGHVFLKQENVDEGHN